MSNDANDDLTTPQDVEIDLSAAFDDEPAATEDVEINLDFGDFSEPEESGTELNLDLAGLGDAESDEDDADEESDQALEKALEELRAELRAKPGDWYVVHTYSGMENRVKQNIDARVVTLNMEDYIFETLVPTEDAVEIRNGQKKNVTRTFMPGYVLVRMDLTEESWAAVRHTASVTGFVGHASNPVPLDLDEVERMLTPSVQAKVAAAAVGPTRRHQEGRGRLPGGRLGHRGGWAVHGVHATITEINVHNQRVKAW